MWSISPQDYWRTANKKACLLRDADGGDNAVVNDNDNGDIKEEEGEEEEKADDIGVVDVNLGSWSDDNDHNVVRRVQFVSDVRDSWCRLDNQMDRNQEDH